ncbi:uncharacterized protein LODBEIA_P58580 [Lodderomyces beijingensis]|uniref:Sister chromatid cohesion protein DCC1 n=1 Tax=Lodderomyces beijingensis TaxID=1775926 RepID=A0ABP0ZU14_9ASCO
MCFKPSTVGSVASRTVSSERRVQDEVEIAREIFQTTRVVTISVATKPHPMTSISVYSKLQPDKSHIYKLIQLPNDLLEKLPTSLQLKSNFNGDGLVLCTQDETFRVRQNNHSNTVLLMRELNTCDHGVRDGDGQVEGDAMVGFASCHYEYEVTPTVPSIDLASRVPLLHHRDVIAGKYAGDEKHGSVSKMELMRSSCSSSGQFEMLWTELALCSIDSHVFQMARDLRVAVLHDLITYKLSYPDVKLEDAKLEWGGDMVKTVLDKYTTRTREGDRVLNDHLIVVEFGVVALSQAHTHKTGDLMINWKLSLPQFYSPSLDLKMLRGHYVTSSNGGGDEYVTYVDPESLSRDVGVRIKQLLAVQASWPYDEFVSFLEGVVPGGRKVDAVVIKFARKKKVGRDKFVVVPR